MPLRMKPVEFCSFCNIWGWYRDFPQIISQCVSESEVALYWNISHCNISHKVKLEEWAVNPLPSDDEADVLTNWLKAWHVSQAASSLPILIGKLQYIWRVA